MLKNGGYIMLKPLGDRLVLKVNEEKEQVVGGFVLAGSSKEVTKTAEVISVGTGTRTLTGELVPPTVKAGDKVILESFSGVTVKDGEETFLIVHESEILAIID